MRFLLILAAIMIQLSLANASWAKSYDDCKVSCTWDKGERDVECPSPYEYSDSSQRRDQCLQKNNEIYARCIQKCPPPPPPPPEEAAPSTMSY